MVRLFCFVLASLALSVGSPLFVWPAQGPAATGGTSGTSGTPKAPCQLPAKVSWQTDYRHAMDVAAQRRTLLVVLFVPPKGDPTPARFESEVLTSAEVSSKMRDFVAVRLAIDARIADGGHEVELLKHPAFGGMAGRPGLAIIDLVHEDPDRWGRVVGTLPLEGDRLPKPSDVTALLDAAGALPAGVDPGRTALSSLPSTGPVADGPKKPSRFSWRSDYAEAMAAATREQKMLLVLFCRTGKCPLAEQFEAAALSDPAVAEKLTGMVRVRLPLDAKAKLEGREVELLKDPAFAEMLELPGIAMIDLVRKDSKFYGQVVSVFPFVGDRVYTADELKVMLDLPPGTLTQRTLIYAVRTHPERPASTSGELSPLLAQEAESHSEYQARINRQGHHFWESRFHRINALLGGGMTSSEVCAESWPGQGLLQAAIECVRCWRLSSGHWGAVSGAHRAYGYDMKRGSNGVWYATGIFGRSY